MTDDERDAARWRYVRDELAQAMDFSMDGTCAWRFRSPRGRGTSIEELIDNLIEEWIDLCEEFEAG